MKYVVFAIAMAGVPPLAFLLYLNERWRKYAFSGIMLALIAYNSTSINFLSREAYAGTSRGMEVSLAHLVAVSLLGALWLGRKVGGMFPETGFKVFVAYFLLCLPSLFSDVDPVLSWFELWKMLLLYVFGVSIYWYFKATDDLKSALQWLAAYTAINAAAVVKARLAGAYQAHGLFPHQNSMAMAMMLLGTVFFAAYLVNGTKNTVGRVGLVAFLCAAFSVLRSFSRGAIALMPVGFGITVLLCLRQGASRRVWPRLAPIAAAGLVAAAIALPKIVERFQNAPESSGNTRVELAHCAFQMISERPMTGVGINNWSRKMQYPYKYQERASEVLGKDLDMGGIVETVYLLILAECGWPAFLAFLAWLGWYWISCVRLLRRLRGTRWAFLPAGLLGGLTANCLQCCLEWVLRQQINLFLLMFLFAMVSYLNRSWRGLRELDGAPPLLR